MWKFPSILILISSMAFAGTQCLAQDKQQENSTLVGLQKDEVVSLIKQEHKGFRKDQSIVNQQFNYLKYVNRARTKTWILYFDKKDRCRSSKLVCDYVEYDEVIKELNKNFQVQDEFRWKRGKGKQGTTIVLSKQDWYFTVREARDK